MKTIIKIIKEIIIGIWICLAIFATICLISSNEYGVSEFGDKSLFVIDNRSLEDYGFNRYDIVITTRGLENDYNEKDQVFFYYGNKESKSFVNLGVIDKVERADGAEDSYYFDNNGVSYSNVLGLVNGSMKIEKWGMVLGLLESKWGFMFLIILPTLYAVVYEIYSIIVEVKHKSMNELKDIDNE